MGGNGMVRTPGGMEVSHLASRESCSLRARRASTLSPIAERVEERTRVLEGSPSGCKEGGWKT